MNEAIRIGMYKKMQEAIMYCMRYFSPLLLIYWLTKIKSFLDTNAILDCLKCEISHYCEISLEQ